MEKTIKMRATRLLMLVPVASAIIAFSSMKARADNAGARIAGTAGIAEMTGMAGTESKAGIIDSKDSAIKKDLKEAPASYVCEKMDDSSGFKLRKREEFLLEFAPGSEKQLGDILGGKLLKGDIEFTITARSVNLELAKKIFAERIGALPEEVLMSEAKELKDKFWKDKANPFWAHHTYLITFGRSEAETAEGLTAKISQLEKEKDEDFIDRNLSPIKEGLAELKAVKYSPEVKALQYSMFKLVQRQKDIIDSSCKMWYKDLLLKTGAAIKSIEAWELDKSKEGLDEAEALYKKLKKYQGKGPYTDVDYKFMENGIANTRDSLKKREAELEKKMGIEKKARSDLETAEKLQKKVEEQKKKEEEKAAKDRIKAAEKETGKKADTEWRKQQEEAYAKGMAEAKAEKEAAKLKKEEEKKAAEKIIKFESPVVVATAPVVVGTKPAEMKMKDELSSKSKDFEKLAAKVPEAKKVSDWLNALTKKDDRELALNVITAFNAAWESNSDLKGVYNEFYVRGIFNSMEKNNVPKPPKVAQQ